MVGERAVWQQNKCARSTRALSSPRPPASPPASRLWRPRRVPRRHGARGQVSHQGDVGGGGAVHGQPPQGVPLEIGRRVRGAHVLGSVVVVMAASAAAWARSRARPPQPPRLLSPTMTRSAAGKCTRASAASHASARVRPGPGGAGAGEDQASSADESAAYASPSYALNPPRPDPSNWASTILAAANVKSERRASAAVRSGERPPKLQGWRLGRVSACRPAASVANWRCIHLSLGTCCCALAAGARAGARRRARAAGAGGRRAALLGRSHDARIAGCRP